MSSDRPSDASHRGVLAQRQDHPVLCRDDDGHQRDYLLRHEPFSRPTAGTIATFTAEDLALGTASKQQDRDQGTPAILATVDRVTWLEQRRPDPDVILLRDYPAGEVVRITCQYCPRAGRYRLARLVERFGPAAGL